MSEFVKVANAAELQADKPFAASIDGKSILVLFHNGNYYACDRDCPHRMTPLDYGTLDGGKLFCPMHGWGFDLQTGDCDTNPEKPLGVYPIRVENGEVQVKLR